ncbi:hypothetical protein [Conchiformibius kuhniae]|uniref:Uncharacterized protein n=1 Tax=Conchiformibius kuhniae TaxID=211502 RepID=A0A8T9MT23_9NEIS|nr:hypothetical protein [Conchiformibius kuhniae]UOP04409.1 hypothetical protein LVJ77_08815 [Conchiformibius kuhniae]
MAFLFGRGASPSESGQGIGLCFMCSSVGLKHCSGGEDKARLATNQTFFTNKIPNKNNNYTIFSQISRQTL